MLRGVAYWWSHPLVEALFNTEIIIDNKEIRISWIF